MSSVAASLVRDSRTFATKAARFALSVVAEPRDPHAPQPPDGRTAAEAADIDLRQLRHHTKNTLQRIIGLISEAPGLSDTPAGEKLARDLQDRICLSATISNALFGLTEAPGSMAARLRQLTGAIVDMMRATDQMIRVGVSVKGHCPADLREAVMRSAHELVGNAVKHGMKGRLSGRVAVRLVSDCGITTLSVIDNGWGFTGTPKIGEGLSLAKGFAELVGGSLDLDGADGTVATLELPHKSSFRQTGISQPDKTARSNIGLERADRFRSA